MKKELSALISWLLQNGLRKEAVDIQRVLDNPSHNRPEVTVDKDGEYVTFRTNGGRLKVMENSKWAQGAHSVTDFEVDEERRGQGIGKVLVEAVVDHYSGQHISAQISSLASLKVFMNFGFRPLAEHGASFEEAAQAFKQEGGSLNLRLNSPMSLD